MFFPKQNWACHSSHRKEPGLFSQYLQWHCPSWSLFCPNNSSQVSPGSRTSTAAGLHEATRLDTVLENGLNVQLKLGELLANPVTKLQGQVPSRASWWLAWTRSLWCHPLNQVLEGRALEAVVLFGRCNPWEQGSHVYGNPLGSGGNAGLHSAWDCVSNKLPGEMTGAALGPCFHSQGLRASLSPRAGLELRCEGCLWGSEEAAQLESAVRPSSPEQTPRHGSRDQPSGKSWRGCK